MKKSLSAFLLLLCTHLAHAVALPTSVAITTTPDLPAKIRAIHFVLRAVSLVDARRIVDIASAAGFNTVQMTISDGVSLDHAPWTPARDAWSKAELINWISYTKGKGMAIVPELKLLTHQETLFQNRYPSSMFNSLTYDPRKAETYQKVFALIDEIIDLVHPNAINIGHDEVAGFSPWSWNKRLNPNSLGEHERMLPSDLFLKDALKIHAFLKQRGVETWMWGDMLVSSGEFAAMGANSLHGSAIGYGKELRSKLPKDIIICDWHYKDEQEDFPSLMAFNQEGFRVIGATWKKAKTINNFSHYAAQHGAYGMMATTWFHVQRKEWDVVERIIRESGAAFSRDFPNAK